MINKREPSAEPPPAASGRGVVAAAAHPSLIPGVSRWRCRYEPAGRSWRVAAGSSKRVLRWWLLCRSFARASRKENSPEGAVGAGRVSRPDRALCAPRGLEPLPSPHQAWPGARLARHFHQSSWNYYCCLFTACARVWIGARGYLQLKDGSKLFPRAALPVQQCVLKSSPKRCDFPIFPYPTTSLTALFPPLFLWIHLGEFPAVVLRFSPINVGWAEGGQAGPAAPTSPC